nr:hypothetical protein [Lachnospiraceae bacterium]
TCMKPKHIKKLLMSEIEGSTAYMPHTHCNIWVNITVLIAPPCDADLTGSYQQQIVHLYLEKKILPLRENLRGIFLSYYAVS